MSDTVQSASPASAPASTDVVVEVRDLTAGYLPGVNILTGANLIARKGELIGKAYRMRALLNVVSQPRPPDVTEDQIRLNPLGIYVSDYSWSKQF